MSWFENPWGKKALPPATPEQEPVLDLPNIEPEEPVPSVGEAQAAAEARAAETAAMPTGTPTVVEAPPSPVEVDIPLEMKPELSEREQDLQILVALRGLQVAGVDSTLKEQELALPQIKAAFDTAASILYELGRYPQLNQQQIRNGLVLMVQQGALAAMVDEYQARVPKVTATPTGQITQEALRTGGMSFPETKQ